jgi:hypothetical protein
MSSWPIWLVGLLLVVVLPALAVAVQAVLRRAWPALREGDHNEVAGFIIAVVGVIYAVLLAFVVIVSWEKFNEAESVVGQEASALRNIYRDSTAFPPEVRDRLHYSVRSYTTTVIQQEWPAPRLSRPTWASRRTGSTTWLPPARIGSTSSSKACPGCCGRP